MAKTILYRGKRYRVWSFRFNKKEANSLASSLRKEYKSAIVKQETNRKGSVIYVVYILGRKLKKNPAKKKKRTVDEDTQQRRKYARGGRIEAYTMGEASKGKGFPW